MTVEERVLRVVAEELGGWNRPNDSITRHTKISEDLGADSLDEVEVIMGLEKEFNIDITDEDCTRVMKNGYTVLDLINLVDSTLQKNAV